jgi:hypothetical protein
MTSNSIPVISFEPFLKGDREQRAQVAQDVYQAFHDVGFLYLKDFGITQAEVDEIFNLVSAPRLKSWALFRLTYWFTFDVFTVRRVLWPAT